MQLHGLRCGRWAPAIPYGCARDSPTEGQIARNSPKLPINHSRRSRPFAVSQEQAPGTALYKCQLFHGWPRGQRNQGSHHGETDHQSDGRRCESHYSPHRLCNGNRVHSPSLLKALAGVTPGKALISQPNPTLNRSAEARRFQKLGVVAAPGYLCVRSLQHRKRTFQ
jgi:hypothetical protein